MRDIKKQLYAHLVEKNREVKAHYEGFIMSNPEYHQKHRMESYYFLKRLKEYYASNCRGEFPKAPREYVPRLLEISIDSEKKKNDDDEILQVEGDNIVNRNIDENWDYFLIKNSLYFDEKWYLKEYPDVVGKDAVKHYLEEGWREFRRPGPSFSTLLYLNRYDDAREAGINPLVHYEKIGKMDKRVSSYRGLYKQVEEDLELIRKSKFFNEKWYRNKYLQGDVTRENAVVHYFCLGCYIGMEPGPTFDSNLYEKSYPEVCKMTIPYLLHYELGAKTRGNGYIAKSTKYYSNMGLQNRILKEMYSILLDMYRCTNANTGKKVLLISHIMNLTGAPRVCLNMAVSMKKMGYYPVIMTLRNGELNEEAEREGIHVLEVTCYEKSRIAKEMVEFVNQFDYILFNTVESLRLAHIFQFTFPKKIGWFHEGNETLKIIPEKQIKRINLMDDIYMVSPYCYQFFEPYIEKKEEVKTLFYGVDGEYIENCAKNVSDEIKNKLIFITVGTIGYRKGVPLLLEVIEKLPAKDKSCCEFWLVGDIIDEEVGNKLKELMKNERCIKYLGALPYEQVIEAEKKSDVLICPSIDDPLPVVITESMILGNPVIISDMVGTSALIEHGESGFIFESGNEKQIRLILQNIIKNKYDLKKIAENAREIYKNNLSLEHFDESIRNMLQAEHKVECNGRTIDNKVVLLDVIKRNEGYDFVFSCDAANELYLLNEGRTYVEKLDIDPHFKMLNSYYLKKDERIAIISVVASSLNDYSVIVGSEKFDTIEISVGTYSWIKFSNLVKAEDACLWLNENIISFINKKEFIRRVKTTRAISNEEKRFIKEVSEIEEFPYNVYTETRNNCNDNAYTLFLSDLKNNDNAYFVTTQEMFDKETNPRIKEHLLIVNMPETKEIMVRANSIIVSWHATPIFGEARMKFLYPFLRMNYVFVPHGISYDKDSYYLHQSNWGYFSKVICASRYEKEYFEKICNYNCVEIGGYPRMDKWYAKRYDAKKIFLFPTWREEIEDAYIQNILDICKSITNELPGYQIVYAAHPSIEKQMYKNIANQITRISPKIISFMCEDGESFNEHFESSKFLITDYSSVAYDFVYKKGAVPIYFTSFYEGKNNYEFREEFYKHNCGISVQNTKELVNVLKDAKCACRIRKRVNDFFAYRDGNNTKRVMSMINNISDNKE